MLDAVPRIHAESSHVATDKDPSKQSTTNRNSQKESTWHAIGWYRLFQ